MDLTKLLDKLNDYNLFNFLLPGILFATLADRLLATHLTPPDLLTAPFLYYFYGMTLSRIGSVVVEPLAVRGQFIKAHDRRDYPAVLAALARDPKLELLSGLSNAYRTAAAVMLTLLAGLALQKLLEALPRLSGLVEVGALVALAALFLAAWRKQDTVIARRVEAGTPKAP